MTKLSTHPIPTIHLLKPTFYHVAALFLCALCLHPNSSSANDTNKNMSTEAMKQKDVNHEEMKHDGMNHGKVKHDNMKHQTADHDKMDHGKMDHDKMTHENMQDGHGHTTVDVSSWSSTPSLTLTAHRDAMSGWNLHIVPTHFDFAPDQVNAANVAGKGHAHLYINGKKLTRLYSNWYYLNNLQPGVHSVTVSLNANDHGPLVLNDQHISATIELTQE